MPVAAADHDELEPASRLLAVETRQVGRKRIARAAVRVTEDEQQRSATFTTEALEPHRGVDLIDGRAGWQAQNTLSRGVLLPRLPVRACPP